MEDILLPTYDQGQYGVGFNPRSLDSMEVVCISYRPVRGLRVFLECVEFPRPQSYTNSSVRCSTLQFLPTKCWFYQFRSVCGSTIWAFDFWSVLRLDCYATNDQEQRNSRT